MACEIIYKDKTYTPEDFYALIESGEIKINASNEAISDDTIYDTDEVTNEIEEEQEFEAVQRILNNPYSLAWFDVSNQDERYSFYDLSNSIKSYYDGALSKGDISQSEYDTVTAKIETWTINNNSRINKLNELLKDTTINKVGLEVEYTLDTELIAILPDTLPIKDKLLKGEALTEQEIQDYAGEIPVLANINYGGEIYSGHLHNASFVKDVHSSGKPKMIANEEGVSVTYPSGEQQELKTINSFENSLIQLKSQLYEAAFRQNKTVSGTLNYINGGIFNFGTEYNALTSLTKGTEEVTKEDLQIFMYSDKGYTDSGDIILNDGIAKYGKEVIGSIALKLQMMDGRNLMSRLRVEPLNQAESELIWEAYVKFFSKEDNITDQEILVNGKVGSTNISPRNLIDLLVHNRNFTKDNKRSTMTAENAKRYLGFYDDTLYFGEAGIITAEDVTNPEKKQEFIAWLVENKLRQVDASKLNGSIFAGRKMATNSFSIYGKEFNSENSDYNSFLTDVSDFRATPVLTTKLKDIMAYQPTVSLSTDFSSITEQEEVDTDIFGEKSTKELEDAPENPWSTDETNDDLGLTSYRAEPMDTSKIEVVDMTEEVEWFKKNLPQIPLKELERLMKISTNKVAFGAFVSSIDVLSDFQGQYGVYYTQQQPVNDRGTLYHEAIHATSKLLLSIKEHKAVFAEAKETWGDLTEEQLEEKMAEDFRMWKMSKGKYSVPKARKSFFEKIMTYIRGLFGKTSALKRMYRNIDSGFYSGRVPITMNITKFSKMYSSATVEEAPEFLAEDLDKFVDAFTSQVFRDNELTDLTNITTISINTDNFKKLFKQSQVINVLKERFNIAVSNNNEEAIHELKKVKRRQDLMLAVLEKNPDSIKRLVLDKLDNKYGITPKDQNEVLNEDEMTQEKWDKIAFESSYKDNATTFVKMLIATLPKVNSLGELKINDITGLPENVSYDATYNFIIENFAKNNITTQRVLTEEEFDVANEVLEKQIKTLENLSQFKPELSLLAGKLRKYDTNPTLKHLATQFSIAMMITGNQFEGIFIEEISEDAEGFTFNVGNLDTQSKEESVLTEFTNGFKESQMVYGYNGKETIDTKRLDAWIESYEALTKKVKAKKSDIGYDKLIDETLTLFSEVGINITEEAFNYHLANNLSVSNLGNFKTRYLVKFLETEFSGVVFGTTARNQRSTKEISASSLIGISNRQKAYNDFVFKSKDEGKIAELDATFRDNQGSINFTFSDEKYVKALANSVTFFRDDLNDSTILGAENNRIWKYSNPTFMHNLVGYLKNNPEALGLYNDKQYHSKSLWLSEMERNPQILQNLKLVDLNSIVTTVRKENENVKSKDSDELTEYVAIINSTLNQRKSKDGTYTLGSHTSRFRLGSFADKSRSHILVDGFAMVDTVPSKSSTKKNAAMTYNLFAGYFLAELERMIYVEKNKIGLGVIENYITRDNYKRSYTFPELSHPDVIDMESISPAAKKLSEHIYGTAKDRIDLTQLEAKSLMDTDLFTDYVDEKLSGILNEEYKYWKELEIDEKHIDPAIMAYYGGEIKDVIRDYTLNSMIANIETTKLFDGDPAFYKNLGDFTKRTPAKQTTGLQPRIATKEDLLFNIAVAEDIEKPSDYITEEYSDTAIAPLVKARQIKFLQEQGKEVTDENLRASFKGYTKETLEEIYKLEARKMLFSQNMEGGYKTTNRTDAAAYITLDRLEQIMRMLGRYIPNKHDDVFIRLRKGTANYDDIKYITTQPLKGVFYTLLDNKGVKQPVYLKYSQFPLIPQVVKGTKLENVMNKMNEAKVHELVYNSGIKVGAKNVTDISAEDLDFTGRTMALPNYDWKLQQDLPTKYWKKEKTLDGSQYRKNIYVNVFLDEMYGDLTGAELIAESEALDSRRSDIELDKLIEELGIQDGDIKDRDKLYGLLSSELLSREHDSNILKAILAQIPIDALPQYQKRIQNLLSSIVVSRSVKLQAPGGAFIQIPEEMMNKPSKYSELSAEERNDIIYTMPESKLRPTLVKDGKVVPGTVFLPHKLTTLIPKKVLATKDWNKMKDYIDERLLGVVGYRIPNQPLASIDTLNIGGFLPSYMGDTVIMYDDTTTKYGSDYDIDKTYMVMPHYEVVKIDGENHVDYVQYDKEAGVAGNSKKAIENRKIELYKEIQSHPLTHLQSVNPLDAAWLKDDIYALHNPTIPSDVDFWTNKTQIGIKRNNVLSKTGVGLTANVITDLSRIRIANSIIRVRLGIGNETEDGFIDTTRMFDEESNYIFENINAFLNAYVDAAKDPFIVSGNYTALTFNPAMLLFKAGIKRSWINRFIGQPILKEYVSRENIGQSPLKQPKVAEEGTSKGKTLTPLDELIESLGDEGLYHFYDQYKEEDSLERLMKKWYRLESKLEDEITKGGELSDRERAEILWMFKKLQDIAKEDSNATLASKSDTVGHGKNLADAIITEERIRKTLKLNEIEFEEFRKMMMGDTYDEAILTNSDQVISNFYRKFKDTSLGTFFTNSVYVMQSLGENEFITFNEQSKTEARRIALKLGQVYMTNEDILNSIYDNLYSYFYSNSPIANLSTNNLKDMFYNTEDNESLAQEYYNLTNRLDEELKSELENTVFPQVLHAAVGKSTTKPYFIYSNNTKFKDKDAVEQFMSTWLDMYNGKYSPELTLFAAKLVRYAYYTSGFNYGLNSFHQFIPVEMLQGIRDKEGNNTIDYIQNLKSNLTEANYANFEDQYFRNSFNNTKIVPRIAKNNRSPLRNITKEVFSTNEDVQKNIYNNVVVVNEKGSSSTIAGVDKNNFIVWKPFISVKSDKFNVDLYEFLGWKTNTTGKKPVKEAYYGKTYKLGLYDKGKRIVEYDMNSSITESFITSKSEILNPTSKSLIFNSLGLIENGVTENEYDKHAHKSTLISKPESVKVEGTEVEQVEEGVITNLEDFPPENNWYEKDNKKDCLG